MLRSEPNLEGVVMMWRFLFIAFLIAHGVVHLLVWLTPPAKDREVPFDPSRSWLLGERRGLAAAFAVAASTILVLAGIGLWAHAEWWRPVGLVGLAVSFGFIVLWFNPWFLFIEGVNAALFAAIAWMSWPTRSMVGV